MKIVFVSNYFNHHQKPFCDEIYRLSSGNFTFISTQTMREERRKLGYSDLQVPDYVLLSYLDEEHARQAQELIDTADIVLAGSAPEKMLLKRAWIGKVLFRYSERPFKQKCSALKSFIYFLKWNLINPMGKPIYMLCASAYTAGDYRKFGLFKNRTYQWGYFPETKRYDDIDRLLDNKKKTSILWCGRFLDWKHPDDMIEVAMRLKNDGYTFTMNLIGAGVMEQELSDMIKEYGLENDVYLLGALKPREVREKMEQSGIYLMTSDRREGWGAVLNEALNSACAVVASHEAGAVPFLIQDNENGLIYESGNVELLYKKVKYLLDNPHKQELLGKKAYDTMIHEWNAETAAERFWHLSCQILSGKRYPDLYTEGPCSKALVLTDEWKGTFD